MYLCALELKQFGLGSIPASMLKSSLIKYLVSLYKKKWLIYLGYVIV